MKQYLKNAAKSLRAAETDFNCAFNEYWKSLPTPSTNDFDSYNEQFLQIHRNMIKTHDSRSAIKATANEFFRRAICKESGMTLEKAIQYARSFEAYKEGCKHAIWRLIEHDGLVGGDDSFEDFMDSLMAFGHKAFKTALLGGYRDGHEMLADIHKTSPIQASYIGNELYISAALKSAASRAVAIEA